MIILYKCEYCKRIFETKISIVEHYKDCLENPENRTCLTCAHYYIIAEPDETIKDCKIRKMTYKGYKGEIMIKCFWHQNKCLEK